MAHTEHLPLYKAASPRYGLRPTRGNRAPTTPSSAKRVPRERNFSRYHEYAIGTHLREGALRVLRLVVRANSRVDKLPVLLRLREELEELKVLLRLCPLRYAPFGRYSG